MADPVHVIDTGNQAAVGLGQDEGINPKVQDVQPDGNIANLGNQVVNATVDMIYNMTRKEWDSLSPRDQRLKAMQYVI